MWAEGRTCFTNVCATREVATTQASVAEYITLYLLVLIGGRQGGRFN